MSGSIHKPGDLVDGRYLIKKYIGAGGMQEVYKAKDTLLSRFVALKVPKNLSAAKRFKRSAVASAKINHGNVAKTLDYVEFKNNAYLIEEYISGVDLAQLLRKRVSVLDPITAALVFHRLARGLAASHHAGVIHRDLKPGNIMAVGGEQLRDVKITDFGIAKMTEAELEEAVEGGNESLTASQTAIGALPYMSPEMIESVADAGKPTDIWSLGALMFELISGKKPFGAGLKAVPAIVAGELPGPPAFLTGNAQFARLGHELFELLSQCMIVEPGDRLSADELADACGSLCYSDAEREIGVISTIKYGKWGFIEAGQGKGVFFHIESVYGPNQMIIEGDRVLFSRHKGGGNDRAFPVLKMLA